VPIPLNINIFDKGVGGVPSTTLLDNLGGRAQSYTHTIMATGGFESMQVSFPVSFDEAIDWLTNGLLRPAIVAGPEATTCWEGFCSEVSATFGQEQRSASLDGMGNRVRIKYTTVLGVPGTTATTSDATSQASYGIKDLILSVGSFTATAATQLRDVALGEHKYPVMTPATTIASGDLGDVQLTLSFAGWYTAFDWLVTSNSTTSTAVTTAQIQTLTTAYVAVNNFFSVDYGEIDASGISDTQYIEAETTYREKIEKLLAQGTGTQRLAYGIYEGRKWKITTWAGATPGTITYQRSLTSGDVFDAYGGIVSPWLVRPNAMYQAIELLDTSPVATQQDAAARFYVERVTCQISGDSIGMTLEPATSSALDARLARIK